MAEQLVAADVAHHFSQLPFCITQFESGKLTLLLPFLLWVARQIA